VSTTLEQLFSQFTSAAQAARDQQDKWLIIDPVYEHLETLQDAALEQVLPHILTLIETYPELDYGGPGPFGSLIEEHPMAAYTPALLASLERQPSVQVIGWLDRTMRVDELSARRPEPGRSRRICRRAAQDRRFAPGLGRLQGVRADLSQGSEIARSGPGARATG
jgi:hypothetical protein